MKIPFSIGDKKFMIEPYCTNQEKDILLSSSFGVHEFDIIFDILGFSTEHDLSDDEKRVILYKFREVSLGDEVDIKFTCSECGQGNESTLEISNFVQDAELSDSDIRKLNKTVTDDNLQEFVVGGGNVDDLDIEDFEVLKQRIIRNQVKIGFIKSTKCLKCQHPKNFDLSSAEYIVEIMSDDTLMTLYKSYNFLIYFGKYSKEGVDSMYPFERTIFIGLLNKTKEDLAK